MKPSSESYIELEKHFSRLLALREAAGLLHWDASTMMPKGINSSNARSEQISAIATICHEIINDNKVSDLLDEAEDSSNLTIWQTSNLREMRHIWTHETAIPKDLIEALTKASMNCETQWRISKVDSDYKSIKPYLNEVLKLVKHSALAKSEVLNCTPYEALMDQHTPGLRETTINPLFKDFEDFLPNFLKAVLEKQASEPQVDKPKGPFPIKQQKELGHSFMKMLGFDFTEGRLDVSLHPFSGGTPDDLRITTRYDLNDFTSSLMGVLHETGHALYEKNLPKDWRRQPVGLARGMDIHESQSLLIEMQACRSREFLSYAVPLMKRAFNFNGPEWNTENIYRLYTKVQPSLIRVDADEVTYPAHVILRYNIEKSLISDKITLNDLPEMWNENMKKMLGITPTNHELGCLQDIHWFDGAWGYFPSYTLGAMNAAQLFNSAVRENTSILPSIKRGDFGPLYDWLIENIHGLGSLYETPELLERATGQPLNAEIFKQHLISRYLN
ncbi:MAG: carboxypeptidase M32 [Rhodospirillales bacterium]|tara:strand:- start:2754 stop:4259 length:1506 start_codon:yes stop_codon:yes gene_type:complete